MAKSQRRSSKEIRKPKKAAVANANPATTPDAILGVKVPSRAPKQAR